MNDDPSSTDSEEEILPYPYNKLPIGRWDELKIQLKKVNALLYEVDNEDGDFNN